MKCIKYNSSGFESSFMKRKQKANGNYLNN